MYSGGEHCRSSRAGSVVFVDSRYNQSYLNAEATKVFEENMESLGEIRNSSCFEFLLTLYCHLLYPDCLTVTKGFRNYSYPSPLCSDACFTGFGDKGDCASSYQQTIAIYQLSFAKKSITPIHMIFKTPNCAQLPSSTNSQCMTLKTPASTLAKSQISTPVIVAVFLSFALLAALLILIIVLFNRRKRRKSQNESYAVQTGRSSCHNYEGFPLVPVPLRPSLSDSATEEKIQEVAISPDRLQIQDIIGEGAAVETHLVTFLKIFALL